jgi:hypothetical protein
MQIVEKKLTSSELSDLKKKEVRQTKKILSESLIAGILTFFGLMLLLLLCENMGLNIPSVYSKTSIIGLSALYATFYYLRGINKFKEQITSKKAVTEYTFRITDYYFQFISNTEYKIYACKTKDNKIVIFQTSQLPTNKLFDTLVIDIHNDQIINVENYSTGNAVNQHNLDFQLIEKYDKEFYIVDKDLFNL